MRKELLLATAAFGVVTSVARAANPPSSTFQNVTAQGLLTAGTITDTGAALVAGLLTAGTITLGADSSGNVSINQAGTGALLNVNLQGTSSNLDIIENGIVVFQAGNITGTKYGAQIPSGLNIPTGVWGTSGPYRTNQAAITQSGSLSGSTTSLIPTLLTYSVVSDSYTDAATGEVGRHVMLQDNLQTGWSGTRIGTDEFVQIFGASANTDGTSPVAVRSQCVQWITSPASPLTIWDHCFALNPVSRVGNTTAGVVTFSDGQSTAEFDTAIDANAAEGKRVGVSVVDANPGGYGGFQAPLFDAAVMIGSQYQPAANLGYRHGLLIGSGPGYQGVATNGTLIGGYGHLGAAGTVDIGIDLRDYTFGTAALDFGGLTYNAGNLQIGRTLIADAASGITIDPTGRVGALSSGTPVSAGTGWDFGSVSQGAVATLAITGGSNSAGVQTLTYSGAALAVGQPFTISGAGSANGQFTVIASSSGSVSYVLNGASAWASGGTINASVVSFSPDGAMQQLSDPYGGLYYATIASTGTISAGVLSGGTLTLTWAGPACAVGSHMSVAGASPAAVNATYVVSASSSGNVSTVTANTWTSGGSVTCTTGGVSALALISAPVLAPGASVPSNPVALTALHGQPGTGVTANLTWTQGGTIAIGHSATLSGAGLVSAAAFSVGSTAGVSCNGTLSSSAVVTNGIITRC